MNKMMILLIRTSFLISGPLGRFRRTQSSNENARNRVRCWSNQLESYDGSFRRQFRINQDKNHSKSVSKQVKESCIYLTHDLPIKVLLGD